MKSEHPNNLGEIPNMEKDTAMNQGKTDQDFAKQQLVSDQEVRHNFCSFSRNHVHMLCKNARFQLQSTDVFGRTNANWHCKSQFDDCWNVDGDLELFLPSTSFTLDST